MTTAVRACAIQACREAALWGDYCPDHSSMPWQIGLKIQKLLFHKAREAGHPIVGISGLYHHLHLSRLGEATMLSGYEPAIPVLPRVWPGTGVKSCERWDAWVAAVEPLGIFTFEDALAEPARKIIQKQESAIEAVSRKLDEVLAILRAKDQQP